MKRCHRALTSPSGSVFLLSRHPKRVAASNPTFDMRQSGSHILAPVLTVIAVSMALTSCERRTPSASWYCWRPDGPCFASPEQCAQSHEVAGEDPGTPCAQRSTAYCSWSCSADACGDNCYSDLAVCEYFTAQERAVYREPCEQRRPPKHPETFPEYSRPDWWCTDLVAETGEDASYCNNSQQECQRYADLVGGHVPARHSRSRAIATWSTCLRRPCAPTTAQEMLDTASSFENSSRDACRRTK